MSENLLSIQVARWLSRKAKIEQLKEDLRYEKDELAKETTDIYTNFENNQSGIDYNGNYCKLVKTPNGDTFLVLITKKDNLKIHQVPEELTP